MDQIIKGIPRKKDPRLIVGIDKADDAGVFRLSDDIALVQTLDFLTPLVDDPFAFGQIAAANSLSDVYAMGGNPMTAMNIVCFPVNTFSVEVLRETLSGGLSKIEEAGAVLAGGHSVEDDEFKYGLSVTGVVHPSRILENGGARDGDLLILTKPVGTGILSTAIKAGIASLKDIEILIETASELNKTASEIMLKYDVAACTDVTGFGLAGHAREMAEASGKEIVIVSSSVPILPGSLEYAGMGLIPAGCHRTMDFCKEFIEIGKGVSRSISDLIFDPQTSGGLLFTINEKDALVCLSEMNDHGIKASVVGMVSGSKRAGHVSII